MAGVGWGKGKREVIALKAEILALLASGATLKEAHDVLKSAGRITLGYTAFTIGVKAIRGPKASIPATPAQPLEVRSEEHTSELQSLMRISYAVFCLKKKKKNRQLIDRQQESYLDKSHKANEKQIKNKQI